MGKKSVYNFTNSVTEDGELFFHAHKMSPADFEPQGSYTLTRTSVGETLCDCPARIYCRHMKMLPKFENAWAGNDEVYNALSEGGKRAVYMETDNSLFRWIAGPELLGEPP